MYTINWLLFRRKAYSDWKNEVLLNRSSIVIYMYTRYRICLNKRMRVYFYGNFRTRRLIETGVYPFTLLIGRTVDVQFFSNCSTPMWSLSASSRRPPTTVAMAFICASESESVGLSSSLWYTQIHSLDESLREIAWRTSSRNLLTDWSLDV